MRDEVHYVLQRGCGSRRVPCAVRETRNGLGIADETLINVVRTAHSVILDDLLATRSTASARLSRS